jgi:hypothetical protein
MKGKGAATGAVPIPHAANIHGISRKIPHRLEVGSKPVIRSAAKHPVMR